MLFGDGPNHNCQICHPTNVVGDISLFHTTQLSQKLVSSALLSVKLSYSLDLLSRCEQSKS